MIALVHYHLRRGGVARVMYAQARVLRDAGEAVCLLTGEPPPEPPPDGVPVYVIPGLGYRTDYSEVALAELAGAMCAPFAEVPLWHIHNHSLGKNPVLTALVRLWAGEGTAMVLQPHDFAEDGRPGNLRLLRETLPDFPRGLYPCGSRIRYAVLQKRDAEILKGAGVPAGQVQVLPNAVSGMTGLPPPANPPARVLYLSRSIRRKNIGELLLWAKVYGDDLAFATSLIPENPAERPRFDRWRDFAVANCLPVTFGLGADPGKHFADVVAWGDVCISTSVGEGFGMSFLEPFLMGRGLVGRNLPAITAGFVADGIQLPGLYDALPVPVSALDSEFWARAVSTVCRWRAAMGVDAVLTAADLRAAWVTDGMIDFGRLDEAAQEAVLAQDVDVALPAPRQPDSEILAMNENVLARDYSEAATLPRLQRLYAGVREAPAADASGERGSADALKVRDAFLDPCGLFLLRS